MRFLSICSGIEAASVAWHPLGWRAAGFAEIDRFPSAVLAHHYPDVPNFGDFTRIEPDAVGPIDLLVGGTPCQSFSVAGLRGGLADDRGNLALEFCRLAQRTRPRWIVWENVPGVLSLDGGRAFAAILGGLAECGYGLAYRVLDAQYVRVDGYPRAVPQRRRRVFVVGYLGDWRRAAAVLFEREGLRRDSPPRREAGQRAAGTVTSRTGSGVGADENHARDGHLVAGPLTACGGTERNHGHGWGQQEFENGYIQPVAFGGNNQSGPIDVATAQTAHGGSGRMDFETETFVAHALRGEGFDASEDGTGRGTPLVPVSAIMPLLEIGKGSSSRGDGPNGSGFGEFGDPMFTLQEGAQHGVALGFSCKDYGNDALSECAPTLRAMGHDGSHANAGGQMAVAFAENSRAELRLCGGDGSVSSQLTTGGGKPGQGQPCVAETWAVRRLTPTECERLQGFPDGYTNVPYRGKPAADGPRYKALGNSMAVNCMRWIGQRIQMVEDMCGSDD